MSCPRAKSHAETLVATGYYRLGPWDDEPADPKQDRYDQLDDLVNTTSEVFLGLTLGCARCHNHKFEPLTMHDYYRMVAIFEPLERPVEGPHRADPADRYAGTDRRCNARQLPTGLFPRASLRSKAAGQSLVAPRPGGQPGPRSRAGVPAVTVASQPKFPAPPGDARTSLRRLTLARWLTDPEQPADGSRDRQPGLAIPLRRRPGADTERLRHDGRASDPSGAAGLAGPLVRRARLEPEGTAPPDPDQQHLPAQHARRPSLRQPLTPRTASSGACPTAGSRSK